MKIFVIIAAFCFSCRVSGQDIDAPSLGLNFGGSLPDSAFSQSSSLNTKTVGSRARLDLKGGASGWAPAADDANPWLLVDLGSNHQLWGITTQGRNDGKQQFTKEYELQISRDAVTFTSLGLFEGNTNKNTKVSHALNNTNARYVRIHPKSCHKKNGCAIRMDLFGYRACDDRNFTLQLRDSCYQFISTLADFDSQKDNCTRGGGSLASITSLEEAQFVGTKVAQVGGTEERAWIGAQRTGQGVGDFAWLNGEDFDFTNWRAGKKHVEPNNHNNKEYCVEINFVRAGLWNDHRCNMLKAAVCEKKA